MTQSTMVIDHINTLNKLFTYLTLIGYKMEIVEHVELLIHSLPNLYDELVNLINNTLTDYLVFKEIATIILEEETRHKNREDSHASS